MKIIGLFITVLGLFLMSSCDDDTEKSNNTVNNTTNNVTNNITNNLTNNTTNNVTNNTTNNNTNNNTGLDYEIIEEETRNVEGEMIHYQLLRILPEGKSPVYGFFAYPADVSEQIPCVMATMPYDVIDWTGEEVDENQALISTPVTVDQLLDTSFLYAFHDFAFFAAFGRFYTGESIENDVDDMAVSLDFLGVHEYVDNTRIGIYGGSWGGFESLYGAANSKIPPAAGVAYFPVSDFSEMVEHLITIPERVANAEKVAEYENFFAPYLERIYLTTGGAPGTEGADYTGYNRQHLVDNITTPFMIWHEMHDTLVPFEQSVKLAEELPEYINPIWYYYDEDLDLETEPLGHGFFSDTIYSFQIAWIFTRLARENQTIYTIHDQEKFNEFMSYIHSLSARGFDNTFIIPVLKTYMDSRVMMFQGEGLPIFAASEVLTEAFNTIWCLDPVISSAELEALFDSEILPSSQCR
ncbi:MAG: prolyl oligopeptidase family serine peptidase [Deltaproteobacteria bacterium]|nr:prolyl oligopeptidase family serine peptidase [Deltaproteobacteria bacterium]